MSENVAYIDTRTAGHRSLLNACLIGMELIDIVSSQDHWLRAPPIVNGFAPHKLGDTVLLDGGTKVILDHRESGGLSAPTVDITRSLDYFSDKYIGPLADVFIDKLCGKPIACGTLPFDQTYQTIISRNGLTARVTRAVNIRNDEVVFHFDLIYGTT